MKKLYNSCIIAFSMFSRIPMPNCDWSQENMAYMMCFFPWVGVVIGAVTWVWGTYGRLLPFQGCLYTVILMLIPYLLTGGIHLDGLLDTADALSAWMPREKRLEILKDVHAGAFAVIIGLAYFALLYGVYSEITLQMLPLAALVFPLGRTLSALSIVSFPKAKPEGTVAVFSRDASTKRVRVVLIVYLILLALLHLFLSPLFGGIQLAAAALIFLWYYRKAMKYFGGTTGDIAGYFLSVFELTTLLVLVLGHVIAAAIV